MAGFASRLGRLRSGLDFGIASIEHDILQGRNLL